MPASLRKIDLRQAGETERTELLNRQWLVTNGLGGFASGTVGGRSTWRYHGLLIAALPAPLGRMMMLNQLDVRLRNASGGSWTLGEAGGSDSTLALMCGGQNFANSSWLGTTRSRCSIR